jgi:hypothetical protein
VKEVIHCLEFNLGSATIAWQDKEKYNAKGFPNNGAVLMQNEGK